MASVPERLMKLETDGQRMRSDIDEMALAQRTQDKALVAIATDRARVVTGAWVANGLTCFFVAVIMFLANRLAAAEAAQFEQRLEKKVLNAVLAANANAVQGPVRQ